MEKLSDKMQQRVDNWKNKTTSSVKPEPSTRRGGKRDYGDVLSEEQWEQEILKSQTRR